MGSRGLGLLGVPPAHSAPEYEHRAYAVAAADACAEEVRRLDTAGLNVSMTWHIGSSGRVNAQAYYCFACARLHKEILLQRSEDGPALREDLT